MTISANPVDIGQSDLSLPQIQSTSVLTVGSATAMGGVGILGWKYLMPVVPVTSPANSGSSGGGGGAASSNYGWVA